MGNKQLPYSSEELSGKVVIVTGGTAGIGYETVKSLVKRGARTFIACSSRKRAEATINQIQSELATSTKGNANARRKFANELVDDKIQLEFLQLNLLSFQSTKKCVQRFKEKDLPLHILINSATLGGVKYKLTADGYESHFQVNHLSHLLLTLDLLPILLKTAATSGDGRIIFVSSSTHAMAQPFDINRLNPSQEEYDRFTAYYDTKLYNIMTGFALQRRLQGTHITVSSLHPGTVEDLNRRLLSAKVDGTLNCAVNPNLNSQQHIYYDRVKPKQPSADSINEVFQEQLWAKSFEMLKGYLSLETEEQFGPSKPCMQPKESKPEDSKPEDQSTSADQQESETEDQPPAADKQELDGQLPTPAADKQEPDSESETEDQPPAQEPDSQLPTADQQQRESEPTNELQGDSKPEDQPSIAENQASPSDESPLQQELIAEKEENLSDKSPLRQEPEDQPLTANQQEKLPPSADQQELQDQVPSADQQESQSLPSGDQQEAQDQLPAANCLQYQQEVK